MKTTITTSSAERTEETAFAFSDLGISGVELTITRSIFGEVQNTMTVMIDQDAVANMADLLSSITINSGYLG